MHLSIAQVTSSAAATSTAQKSGDQFIGNTCDLKEATIYDINDNIEIDVPGFSKQSPLDIHWLISEDHFNPSSPDPSFQDAVLKGTAFHWPACQDQSANNILIINPGTDMLRANGPVAFNWVADNNKAYGCFPFMASNIGNVQAPRGTTLGNLCESRPGWTDSSNPASPGAAPGSSIATSAASSLPQPSAASLTTSLAASGDLTSSTTLSLFTTVATTFMTTTATPPADATTPPADATTPPADATSYETSDATSYDTSGATSYATTPAAASSLNAASPSPNGDRPAQTLHPSHLLVLLPLPSPLQKIPPSTLPFRLLQHLL